MQVFSLWIQIHSNLPHLAPVTRGLLWTFLYTGGWETAPSLTEHEVRLVFYSSGLTWSSQQAFSCIHKLSSDAALKHPFGACQESEVHVHPGRCPQPIYSRASLSPASGFCIDSRSNRGTMAWTCATLLGEMCVDQSHTKFCCHQSVHQPVATGWLDLLIQIICLASSFSVMETQRNEFLHCTAGWEIYLVGWGRCCESLSCRLQDGWQLKRSWRVWKAPHDSSLRNWSEPQRSTYSLFAPFNTPPQLMFQTSFSSYQCSRSGILDTRAAGMAFWGRFPPPPKS